MTAKFKSAYSVHQRVKVSFEDSPSLTKSEQAKLTDTNYILERYIRTGIIDHVQQHEPQYGDFENFDFHEAQNKVAKAKQMFEQLPAKTRHDFQNDPAKFLDFIAEEANIRDMDDGVIGNGDEENKKSSEPEKDEKTEPEKDEKKPE